MSQYYTCMVWKYIITNTGKSSTHCCPHQTISYPWHFHNCFYYFLVNVSRVFLYMCRQIGICVYMCVCIYLYNVYVYVYKYILHTQYTHIINIHSCTTSEFLGGSDGEETACSAGDLGSISGSRRSPGEGNVYPLQYSCLENSMDRGA